MRLGYSPGWAGRSPSGLGPCAEYMLTGRWPMGAAPFMAPQAGAGPGTELEILKAQADGLEQTLSKIRERIDRLEGTGE